MGLILIVALVRLVLGNWNVPQSWIQTAAQAAPDSEPISPLSLSGTITNTGAFFGLAAGAILVKIRGGFDAGGPIWKRIIRFLVGLLGVFILWFGLGEIFPRGEALLPYVLRFLRYCLVGLWVSALAPLSFIRLGLAKQGGRKNGR
jgi:hypothetical protein